MTTPNFPDAALKIVHEVYAKALVDPDFHAQFVSNPNKVLADHGLRSPEGVCYHVVKEYREGGENLPKSGGIDIYLAYPVLEEEVSVDTLGSSDESGDKSVDSVILGGLCCATGSFGAEPSHIDDPRGDASEHASRPSGEPHLHFIPRDRPDGPPEHAHRPPGAPHPHHTPPDRPDDIPRS